MYRIIQDPRCGQPKQLVLPQVLKEKILTSLHNDMGHQGTERILHLIRDRCYWPRMNNDIETWIKKCERCTLSKEPLPRVRPAMGHLLATKPLEVLAIDFTLLEPATDGRENVLVMTAVFTKFTNAVLTRDQSASTTAYIRNGSLSMASHYKSTQIKAEVLRMHTSRNYASCMTSKSHEPHHTTHKATPNVKDLTVRCITFCNHYLQRRKENGRNIFQNCCMPIMWYHMPQPVILHIT